MFELSLKDAREQFKVYLLLGQPQQEDLRPAFESAVSILRKIPVEKEIIREDQAEAFSAQFAQEIEEHESAAR